MPNCVNFSHSRRTLPCTNELISGGAAARSGCQKAGGQTTFMTGAEPKFRVPRFGVGYFQAAPKIAAPSDGITTAATIGIRWWAKQWISARKLAGRRRWALSTWAHLCARGSCQPGCRGWWRLWRASHGSRIYQVTITVRALTDGTRGRRRGGDG